MGGRHAGGTLGVLPRRQADRLHPHRGRRRVRGQGSRGRPWPAARSTTCVATAAGGSCRSAAFIRTWIENHPRLRRTWSTFRPDSSAGLRSAGSTDALACSTGDRAMEGWTMPQLCPTCHRSSPTGRSSASSAARPSPGPAPPAVTRWPAGSSAWSAAPRWPGTAPPGRERHADGDAPGLRAAHHDGALRRPRRLHRRCRRAATPRRSASCSASTSPSRARSSPATAARSRSSSATR